MKIDLAAAARIVPLTALMLGACVSQSAYEQQGQHCILVICACSAVACARAA